MGVSGPPLCDGVEFLSILLRFERNQDSDRGVKFEGGGVWYFVVTFVKG